MILQLQQAQGQWNEGQNDGQWIIVNKKGKEIARLPACLKDFEAMGVIHFGREFELKAYNDGVEKGLERGAAASQVNREIAAGRIAELEEMNVKLAEQLERHIIEGNE